MLLLSYLCESELQSYLRESLSQSYTNLVTHFLRDTSLLGCLFIYCDGLLYYRALFLDRLPRMNIVDLPT
jgi:hypothetical protein